MVQVSTKPQRLTEQLTSPRPSIKLSRQLINPHTMAYRLKDSLGFSLLRCAGQMKTEFTRALRPYDITPEQFALLGLLWEQDGLLQREIAELLKKDRPNVTRILEKLESKGVIQRRTDPKDRRGSRVYLTDKGQEVRPPLEQIALSFRQSAYNGINDAEAELLKQLLNRITDNLS